MIAHLLAAAASAASRRIGRLDRVGGKLHVPPIRYLSILPPIIMIGGAVLLLALASLVSRPLRVRVATIGTVAIAGTAVGISIWQWFDVQDHGPHTYVANAVVMDGFSVLITMLVASAMVRHRTGG